MRDEALRAALVEADAALAAGDPKASFEHSWQTLQQGRKRLSSETVAGAPAFQRRVGFQDIDRPLESLQDGLKQAAERLEFEGEARRALAFVVGWVLRFGSYLARQREDRWDEWAADQRAPVTGVPGGPHIKEVKAVEPRPIVRAPGDSRVEVESFEWTFQLTDIPDTGTPGFSWAITTAATELNHDDIQQARLGFDGVHVPTSWQSTAVALWGPERFGI